MDCVRALDELVSGEGPRKARPAPDETESPWKFSEFFKDRAQKSSSPGT